MANTTPLAANARAVITAVSYKLGLEELHLKDKIDTAVTDDTVAVLVSVENESKIPLRKQDVNLEEVSHSLSAFNYCTHFNLTRL